MNDNNNLVAHVPMMVKWSKLKVEVDFQDGGRLFLEIGSSNISTVDRDILSKFDTQIVFDLLKCESSPNKNRK